MLPACVSQNLHQMKQGEPMDSTNETHITNMNTLHHSTHTQGETQAIGKLLERTMMEKYGPDKLQDHFIVMDTICDATQVNSCVYFIS